MTTDKKETPKPQDERKLLSLFSEILARIESAEKKLDAILEKLSKYLGE